MNARNISTEDKKSSVNQLTKLFTLPVYGDERGSLVVMEELRGIPLSIRRAYYMYDTQPGVRRGYHAHRKLTQFAIAVKGKCRFLLDNGTHHEYVTLDRPDVGLLLEPMIWHEMCDFSDDCVLLVLADQLYDADDYIRDYQLFLTMVNKK